MKKKLTMEEHMSLAQIPLHVPRSTMGPSEMETRNDWD